MTTAPRWLKAGNDGCAALLEAMSSETACEKSDLLSSGAVVGSVTTARAVERLSELSLADLCDIVEFRLDAYPLLADRVSEAMAGAGLPSIIAARDPKEGAINVLGFSPRKALLLATLEHAALVDVEMRNFTLFRDVIDQALELGKLVVASYHDFSGMPPPATLREMIQEAAESGAHAMKFAVTPQKSADLAVLAELLESPAPLRLSVMGMGRLGRISRLWFGQLGSCLNYGYLDEASVPGQWPAGRLKQLLSELRGP
ncbi:MAG: type I 3-dehydroquinate dehydratase [Verrucomicrobiales bacterium]